MGRLRLDEVLPLLDSAAPASLAVYRTDGTVHLSPVWFRWTGEAFEVVIADGDPKLGHLAHDPRATLLVFEATPPFRGVEVHGIADLRTTGVTEARRSIATRYIGGRGAEELVRRRGDTGVVLTLRPGRPRVWDLRELSTGARSR